MSMAGSPHLATRHSRGWEECQTESSADAARQKLREGKALDRDEVFALQVAAEFDLGGEASPRPRLSSMAVLEDLDHTKRELEEAKAAGHEVRSEMARLRREIEQARTRGAVRQAEEHRRLEAENQRLYMKELSGRGLIESLAVHEPASDEEVVLLARMLHLRLEELYEDPRERSCFTLFKCMDADGSGLISYIEFERLVRDEMCLSLDELSDDELRHVWVWIDRNGSGGVMSGEWAAFLRKGEVGGDGLSWRDRRCLTHMARANEVRRARQEAAPEFSRTMAAAEPATEEELLTLSQKLNAVMAQTDIGGWFKLFRRMDEAETGKVTLHQVERAVRLELWISPVEVTDWELLRLWRALDVHASGTISAGEWGRFMRMGEAGKAGPTWQERVMASKREQGDRVRAELHEMMGGEAARGVAGVARAELAELRQLASLLGARARQLLPAVEVGADPTLCAWWRLFQDVDSDGSGCMRLADFSRLVRDRLWLGVRVVPEEALKAAWLAIDADGAGIVGKSAFGAFMRLGEEPSQKRPWRERLAEARKAAADKVRSQLSPQAGHSAPAVEPLEPDAVTELLARLNARMEEVCPAGTSWYSLFRRQATESTGRLAFEDVVVMVREALQMPPSELEEGQLRRLWAALDAEGSGLLTVGELVGFLRRGAKPREDTSWRDKVSSENKARCDQVRRELDGLSGRAFARAVAGEARASLEQVRDVSARINAAAEHVFGDARDGSPIRLFKGMDVSESGRIGLPELTRLVREVLRLPAPAKGVSKSELRAVWLALDHASSGYIVSGEFVAFMRLGARPVSKLGVVEKRQQMATHARAKLEVKRARAMAAQAHDLWVETDARTEELTKLRLELEGLQKGGGSAASEASLPRILPSPASKLNVYSTRAAARSPRGLAGSRARRPLATNLRETLRATVEADGPCSS
jgi:Ca2+-binding EF-hand superfamily protein